MQQEIELVECQVDAKTNIKVLDVQLNFKLRWQFHVRQLQIKLIIRTKIIQTLMRFTWEASMKVERRVYITVFRSVLAHEASAWYTSSTLKKHRKDIIRKLRSIQNQSLRIAAKIYKVIATKTLKMKLHVLSINLHMKKMIIKIMIRMNFRTSCSAIAKTISRIQRDLRDKRERRAKLRKTSTALKRTWLKKELRTNDVTFIQSYTIFSWVRSSRITININDETTTRRHDADLTNSKWRAYSNESEKDNEITTTIVDINWERVKRLRDVEIALLHHDEMKELTMIVKRLVEKCAAETEDECKDKVYKVYFDNQTSLKTVRSMKSNNDQTRLRRIQKACETIRFNDVDLKLRWISRHQKIQSNENADAAAKNVYEMSMSTKMRREIVVITMSICIKVKKKWKSRWSNDINEEHLRRLASKITSKHMLLHKNKHKSHNALLTQLRIEKINFNLFLKERCVLEMISSSCSCEQNVMTMRHVLLSCSNWRDLRMRLKREINITNISKILSTRERITSTLRMILSTKLLKQFKIIVVSKLKEKKWIALST